MPVIAQPIEVMQTGNAIIILVAGVAGVSAIEEFIKIFFQRMRTTDLITKAQCDKCKIDDSQEAKEGEVKRENERLSTNKRIEAISKLTLMIAIKVGVDAKDIQELM